MNKIVPHTLCVTNRVSNHSLRQLGEGYKAALLHEHKRAMVAKLLESLEEYISVEEGLMYADTLEIRAYIDLPRIQEQSHTQERNRLLKEIENLQERNKHLNHLIMGYESNIEELTAPWYKKLFKRGI